MSRFIDLSGKRFTRLVVIQRADNSKSGITRWLCKCDCDKKEIIVQGGNLKNGSTQSCGCLHTEKMTKHGHTKCKKESRIYRVWDNIMQRCNNPNDQEYHNYGGRGITVCERWRKFENFLEDMGEPPIGKSIDRENNDKGYDRENCRWANLKQQQRNRRNNCLIEFNGRIQCRVAWSEETKIPYDIIRWRLNNGWTVEKTLTQPVKSRSK